MCRAHTIVRALLRYRVLPCHPPQRRRCVASTCRRAPVPAQMCARGRAHLHARLCGGTHCVASASDCAAKDKAGFVFRLSADKQNDTLGFPNGNFRAGAPLSARAGAHAQQRAARRPVGPSRGTAAHVARGAGVGRRGPPPSLRCRMPPASSRVMCMRCLHSPARGRRAPRRAPRARRPRG